MLGIIDFSGSLPLCVTIINIICMFINWTNKDACLLACYINNNLAIANRSRVSCENNPVTMKSRLRVTQGHRKQNHWIDHTRLTISRVI